MEKCPICENYGTAFPKSVIETEFGIIRFNRCNNCNISFVENDKLDEIVNSLKSKIEGLESDNNDLEDEKESLKSEIAKLRSQLSSTEDDEMSFSGPREPSFDSPRLSTITLNLNSRNLNLYDYA